MYRPRAQPVETVAETRDILGAGRGDQVAGLGGVVVPIARRAVRRIRMRQRQIKAQMVKQRLRVLREMLDPDEQVALILVRPVTHI